MMERSEVVSLEAAAATEVCRGKVAVMFQSETEVTSLERTRTALQDCAEVRRKRDGGEWSEKEKTGEKEK